MKSKTKMKKGTGGAASTGVSKIKKSVVEKTKKAAGEKPKKKAPSEIKGQQKLKGLASQKKHKFKKANENDMDD